MNASTATLRSVDDDWQSRGLHALPPARAGGDSAGPRSAGDRPASMLPSTPGSVPPSRQEAVQQGTLILVAEDHPTNRRIILRQLALLGFAADGAENGVAALECWRSGDYALLLSDLDMPEMDGFALAGCIRAQESGPGRFPIIAVTAAAPGVGAGRWQAAGMDDALGKPLQAAELQAMLHRWLPRAFPGFAQQAGGVAVASADPASAAAAASGDVLPLDVRMLERLVGTDPLLVSEFLLEFQRSATEVGARLAAACDGGDATQAGAHAHMLQSSARTVGAVPLADVCARMEAAGRAGNLGELRRLWPGFGRAWTAVRDVLDSLPPAPARPPREEDGGPAACARGPA